MPQKEKAEILFVEAVGLQGSGWIQDGTENTSNPIELIGPTRLYIPRTGHMRVQNDNGVWYNEPIRHIRNCPFIKVSEQKERGIEPSPEPHEDIIYLEKGYGTFVAEDATIGTVEYLKQATYNESNPDRAVTATSIYRILKLEEKNEEDIDAEMMAADAVKFVGTLYDKIGKGGYKYNETAIDGICQLLQIFAETYSGKVQAILLNAKQRPSWFLDKVMRFQQTTLTEVSHALELNVVQFKGNSVEYVAKDKVVCTLGSEKLKHDQKMSRFADWLRTQDGHEAYMELKAEIEAAQNALLKQ